VAEGVVYFRVITALKAQTVTGPSDLGKSCTFLGHSLYNIYVGFDDETIHFVHHRVVFVRERHLEILGSNRPLFSIGDQVLGQSVLLIVEADDADFVVMCVVLVGTVGVDVWVVLDGVILLELGVVGRVPSYLLAEVLLLQLTIPRLNGVSLAGARLNIMPALPLHLDALDIEADLLVWGCLLAGGLLGCTHIIY